MATLTDDDIAWVKRMRAASMGGSAPSTNGGGAPRSGSSSGGVMKFGRSKGVAYAEAPVDDLQWYADAIQRSVDDPDKERFRDSNEADLRAIRAELASRGGGGGRRAPAPASAGGGDGFHGDDHGDPGDIPFCRLDATLCHHAERATRGIRW